MSKIGRQPPGAVKASVCLTEQQRGEVRRAVPEAGGAQRSYKSRPRREAPAEKDVSPVMVVTQLGDRQRIDHVVFACAWVVRSGARLGWRSSPCVAAAAVLVMDVSPRG